MACPGALASSNAAKHYWVKQSRGVRLETENPCANVGPTLSWLCYDEVIWPLQESPDEIERRKRKRERQYHQEDRASGRCDRAIRDG